jgi:hypothetical protein
MGKPTAVVNEYLTAFTTGDFVEARSVVAENFSFRGPFIQTGNREAFFVGAAGLASIVRGHRMLRQWEEGDEVCSLYELKLETPIGAGSVLMSEWHTVRNGELTAGRLVFDTAEFREFVPAS